MKWRLTASLAVIVLGVAIPARADYGVSTLTVCNRGTTTTQVVIASNVTHLLYGYLVEGTILKPGACKEVYAHRLASAYVGIAMLDPRGQWVSGTADIVPDLGTKQQSALQALVQKPAPVLTRSAIQLCYRGDTTWYGIRHGGTFPADCSNFHPDPDEGSGPYMSLTTIFQFDPDPSVIFLNASGVGGANSVGGEYFMNITPSADSRDVRASAGTRAGGNAQKNNGDSGPGLCGAVSCWDMLWQAYQQSVRDGTASPRPDGARPREPNTPTQPGVTVGADSIATGGFITAPGGTPTTPRSSGPVVPTATAQLVFGGEIHLGPDGWQNADGSLVRGSLLDFATGIPPLRAGRPQHAAADAAVSKYVAQIRYVLRDFGSACTEYADSTKREALASITSSGFDIDDYGVVQFNTTESPSSSTSADEVRRGAALGNLDLARVSTEDRGCVVVSIPCKQGVCARRTRSEDDSAYNSLTFRVSSASAATLILNALKAIAPLYPDGGLPDRR